MPLLALGERRKAGERMHARFFYEREEPARARVVPPDEAQKQLDAPHAVAEYDRLQSDRLRRLSVNPSTGDSTEDEALRRSLPPEMLPRNAPGQLDDSTEGVHPSVVEALAAKFDNETHRAALMRNLVPLMSDRDRQYVRSQTMDPEIRGLVG